MKLQHLSIIFIIIILPIVIALSVYLDTQISTINMQTQYTTYLNNAAYDAIAAFELNTKNNNYSQLQASEARDINASIETFYRALNNGIGKYTNISIREYTPAVLTTVYDGYYIYTKYFDSEVNNGNGQYQYGLMPKYSYSMRYKKGNDYDFVVLYTLDNRITIMGNVKNASTGLREYVVKSGDLINLNSINIDSIQNEILREHLIYLDDNSEPHSGDFDYYVINQQKIYKENGEDRFFTYSSNYTKDYLHDFDSRLNIINQKHLVNNGRLYSDSAKEYYQNAREFTNWVNTTLESITQANAYVFDSKTNSYITPEFDTDLGTKSLFLTSNDNDPLKELSAFNEHRMSVIKLSIEKSLITAIANYNSHSQVGYEFQMPKLNANDWYKLENYVSMVAFLEGMPIKAKIFNNYTVVSNNSNNQMINQDAIYAIDNQGIYHAYGCSEAGGINNSNRYYYITDFKAKSVDVTGEKQTAVKQLNNNGAGDIEYYYPQSYQACYKCLVNYLGNIDKETFQNKNQDYLIALGRLKYDLLGNMNK